MPTSWIRPSRLRPPTSSRRRWRKAGLVGFSDLQFDAPPDIKWLIVVDNYGTGKSHLMSVLSAIAEVADTVPLVRHAGLQKVTQRIAGKLQGHPDLYRHGRRVVAGLPDRRSRGAPSKAGHTCHPASAVANDKRAFEQMMVLLHKKFPDLGLLYLDELLDLPSQPEGPEACF